ncbi:hypothetical protein J19TS2_35140 [Cohnella xylanilytica]|uniref:TIGR03943 family protein n=1 Tax=Cohnella xylanilytica TaxID=557555 RepID=A0A841U2F0_9BACL|nr:TIGR03943 family protein [Cohnella xylanilytica]MBB6694715.1 TIGR03943 family protein [Cohnella xylanilytica]GIO13959.1 hypothetical protein J19TS2_35140 [Cohnella xylanilytica]
MTETLSRGSIVVRLVRAVILAGIAFYIVHLHNAGRLTLYIAPRMTIYVKLAAVGLYLVAAVLLFEALRAWNGSREEEACEHCAEPARPSALRQFALYGLFLVPLAVFFLTPDTTIGSAMASQKGMNLSSAAGIKEKNREPASRTAAEEGTSSEAPSVSPDSAPIPSGQDGGNRGDGEVGGDGGYADNGGLGGGGRDVPHSSDPLDALFPPDPFSEAYAEYGKKIYGSPLIEVTEKSYMEILTTLDLYSGAFAGHKVRISGFVYRDSSVPEDKFVIGRFAVQCCAADAMPYGILVDSPDAGLHDDNEWLTITGTLATTKYGDNDVLLLKAEEAVKIKAPKDPYVYGDLDFGT